MVGYERLQVRWAESFDQLELQAGLFDHLSDDGLQSFKKREVVS